MFNVTTPENRIISTHSTRKKATARAKKLVFTGKLPATKVECTFRGKLYVRSYSI